MRLQSAKAVTQTIFWGDSGDVEEGGEMKRWSWWLIAYFSWGAAVIGWMIWHDTHLPNCLAIYGAAAHPTDSVMEGVHHSYQFLSCSRANESEAFYAQAVGIGLIVGGPLTILILYGILHGLAALMMPLFRSGVQTKAPQHKAGA